MDEQILAHSSTKTETRELKMTAILLLRACASELDTVTRGQQWITQEQSKTAEKNNVAVQQQMDLFAFGGSGHPFSKNSQ